jgi:hypothetical protein
LDYNQFDLYQGHVIRGSVYGWKSAVLICLYILLAV